MYDSPHERSKLLAALIKHRFAEQLTSSTRSMSLLVLLTVWKPQQPSAQTDGSDFADDKSTYFRLFRRTLGLIVTPVKTGVHPNALKT